MGCMDTGNSVHQCDHAYLICDVDVKRSGFGTIPHFSYGEAVARLGLEPAVQLGAAAVDKPPFGVKILSVPHFDPQGGVQNWSFATLAIYMMMSTASLPHILMRTLQRLCS